MRGGVAGGDLHGAPVGLDRRVRLARGVEDVAEIGPDAGVLRRMPGRLAQHRRAFAALAAAVQEDAEKLQRIRVVGDGREDAAVDRLRDLGIALLVVGYRHGQRFLERRRMDCVAVLGSALLLDRHLCHRPLTVSFSRGRRWLRSPGLAGGRMRGCGAAGKAQYRMRGSPSPVGFADTLSLRERDANRSRRARRMPADFGGVARSSNSAGVALRRMCIVRAWSFRWISSRRLPCSPPMPRRWWRSPSRPVPT